MSQHIASNKCNICIFECVRSLEKSILKASLSGGNYNVTIRDKVCCSQLELGFNWAAVIGLLHLEVEFNTTAFL